MGCGVAEFFPLARSVYVAVRAMTLAMRVATMAVSDALVSISCVSVVRSVVAAKARLSRYPSKRANVSGVIMSP